MTDVGGRGPRPGLTAEQQRAVEEFTRLRGVAPFGPFVDLLPSPELMTRVSALGEYLRYRSALPPRLSEFAILVTAAHWTQAFEWEVHAPIALQAGVSQSAIDSLWARVPPANLDPELQVIYDVCIALHEQRSLPAVLRQKAEVLLGEVATLDVIGICGYYAMLAMVLNSRP